MSIYKLNRNWVLKVEPRPVYPRIPRHRIKAESFWKQIGFRRVPTARLRYNYR